MNKTVNDYILKACSKPINERKSKETCVLDYFISLIEEKVSLSIKERQKQIPDLDTTRNGAVWGGKLTPGCENCLENGLNRIRANSRCNLNCKFCLYFEDDNRHLLSPLHYAIYSSKFQLANIHEIPFTENDVINLFAKRKSVKAVNWISAGDPFMDFEKIPKISKKLTEFNIHQHINTNGLLLTEERMKILQDCGLSEIRFNLAATNFSKIVLDIMKIARKYFKYLCIETPIFKDSFNGFVQNKQQILDTGVDHIDLNELHLHSTNFINFIDEDFYYAKFGRLSPISSRQYSYDLLEMAVNEKWPVVMNECPCERKFYSAIKNELLIGQVYLDYNKEVPYPPHQFFVSSLKRLNQEDEEKIVYLINEYFK